jgi:glycerol-3-phosphate dehydrogenase (NAD(P)+)
MKICILGEGAWGTAIATLLAHNGNIVHLWCVSEEVADEINRTRINNRYLPGVYLSENILAYSDMQEAIGDAIWIFEAIPVYYLRSILVKARYFFNDRQIWVMLSKGIEQDSLFLPSQIIDHLFETNVNKAIVSGPSFAKDLAARCITGAVVAADDYHIAHTLAILLQSYYFKPYLSDDTIGVQVGGALKNVIALGMGMLDGAGYGDNTKALLFTRGFYEITKIAMHWGAQLETLYGLSGIGDLVLTSMGHSSKNFMAGQMIGKGHTLNEVAKTMKILPEGINTVRALYHYLKSTNIHVPLIINIYEALVEQKNISQIFLQLMQSSIQNEFI